MEWSILLIDVPRWDLSVKPEKSSFLHCCQKKKKQNYRQIFVSIVTLFFRSAYRFFKYIGDSHLAFPRSSDHRETIVAKLVLGLTRLCLFRHNRTTGCLWRQYFWIHLAVYTQNVNSVLLEIPFLDFKRYSDLSAVEEIVWRGRRGVGRRIYTWSSLKWVWKTGSPFMWGGGE